MDTQDDGISSEHIDDPAHTTEIQPTNDVAPLATPEMTPTLESLPTPSTLPLDSKDISPEQNSDLLFFQYDPSNPVQSSPLSHSSAPVSPVNLASFIQQYHTIESKPDPSIPARTLVTIFNSKENFPAHNSAPNTLKRKSKKTVRSNSPYSPQHIIAYAPHIDIDSPLHASAPCSPKTELPPPIQGSTDELQMPHIGFLSLLQQPSHRQIPFQREDTIPYSHGDSSHTDGSQMSLGKKGTPTLFPCPDFDPSRDAQILYHALKSSRGEENSLISVLCRRTDIQRQEIAKVYYKICGNYPVRDVKTKTRGNFRNTLMTLCIPLTQFYCQELRKAVVSFGTDEDCLIEVLCSLSNEEINDIKMCYQRLYDNSLEEDIISKISGNFQKLLVSLANATRDESEHTDINDAQADAQDLLNASESNESSLINILCQRNFHQLKLVCQEYESLVGYSLQKTVKKEFKGNTKEALLDVLNCVNDTHDFFAKQLHKSMAGLGTNNSQLIRLVVTRCEVDMVEIKEAFQRMYGKTLKSFIKGDTSGHYKHALYELVNENQNQMLSDSRRSSLAFPVQVQQTSPQKVLRKPECIGCPHGTVQNIEGPTLLPASNFNPFKDAKIIRKALKGFETNEDILANVLCHRTDSQRQKIIKAIKQYFGKDLAAEINSNCSGLFNCLMLTLLTPITELYCEDLHQAIKDTESNVDCLIEVLCSLSNDEINDIKMCYQSMYNSTLEHDLTNETSGHFKKMLVLMCTAKRDESGRTDVYEARADAQDLIESGDLGFGFDESTFNRILCQRNFNQLKLVFQEYKNMSGQSLEMAIKKGFKGEVKIGLLAILDCIYNKSEFCAKRICKSIAGSGRNDSQFMRLIITHCEVDMIEIKEAFYHKYGRTLKSFIKGYALGHYLYALFALIGEDFF